MTHLGSVTWSYKRLSAGAILFVKVPETIIRSDCLGLALKIIPKRSKSYLLRVACIISTAQQANPKVKGHKDPFRTQFTIDSAGIIEYEFRIKRDFNY